MSKHINELPPRFAEVREDLYIPERLEMVIFKALSKDPNHRHSTMEELRSDLQLSMPRPGRNPTLRAAADEAKQPAKQTLDPEQLSKTILTVVSTILILAMGIGTWAFVKFRINAPQPTATPAPQATSSASTTPAPQPISSASTAPAPQPAVQLPATHSAVAPPAVQPIASQAKAPPTVHHQTTPLVRVPAPITPAANAAKREHSLAAHPAIKPPERARNPAPEHKKHHGASGASSSQSAVWESLTKLRDKP